LIGVVLVSLDHVSDPRLRQEIAKRIVACVNAMAGVDDPQAFVERAKINEENLATLNQSRNELIDRLDVEALEDLIANKPRSIVKALAAIERAKGEA